MDPYRPNPTTTTFLAATFDHDDHDDQPQNSMKTVKRKRLAKACDACHKSKRRCDGTAPCSNCFYAVKPCTYTDSSGRPVPAPRPFKPERAEGSSQASTSTNSGFLALDRDDDNAQNNSQHTIPRKRFRDSRGKAVPTEDISTSSIPIPIVESTLSGPIDRPAPLELDHALTRELTNLFFTHCHPARIIIHKPTFTANLAHNRVPIYLLHAVCALAAPLSKQPRLRTNPARFAGRQFAQEAQSLLFDGAGRLVCERNLATAQALCLLQFHDLKTKDQNMYWDSRYHDMALQLIESLNVYQHDYPTLTPVPSPEFIQASIEREAVRRLFWIIHLLDNMAFIYFKKPMEGLQERGRRLRLPVDETTFELGVHSTLPEYLYLPAVRMQYSSEFGHLIRVVTIYAKVESALNELADPESNSQVTGALIDAEHLMDSWANTLPDHLRFSEQSLQVQQSMFETSSNAGAWCWCGMHVFHASSSLALNFARQKLQNGPKSEPAWALRTLDLIMEMLGDRAKNSILMAAALWSLIKYCQRDDAQIRKWCAIYEDAWGTRIRELVMDRGPNYLSPTPHSYTPSHLQQGLSQAQQSLPPQIVQPLPPQPRRLPDVRNPPILGPGPSSHQHDSSFSRRSGSSSPTSLTVSRPLEDLRMHNNHNPGPNSNGNGGFIRAVQSQSHLNSDRDMSGRSIPGSSTCIGVGQGGNGGGVKRERELEGNTIPHGNTLAAHTTRRGITAGDADLDVMDSNGRTGENVHTNAGQGQMRATGLASDGPQSLPSLKSVGLLAVQPIQHQVSMPVGLQWLANESR